MSHAEQLSQALARMPLVAILRGLAPEHAREVGTALVSAGLEVLEVPLNSPDPDKSIGILRDIVEDRVIVGGGTVLSVDDVKRVRDAGGQIAVAPNTNRAVIEACLGGGIVPVPGFATATEALEAVDGGARFLKLFPVDSFPPGHLRSVSAVLPRRISVLAVGGVDTASARIYLDAGYVGLGVGSSLYRPDRTIEELRAAARAMVRICRRWQKG